ncbi:MAG: transglutaminase-like domain-containing protein [Acidobacteriota bacterium]
MRSRTVHLVYEARVPGVPATAGEAFLWIPYPPGTAYQTVSHVTISPGLAHELVTEARFGNRALRFDLPPGTGTATVRLGFDVTRREHRHRFGKGGGEAEGSVTALLGGTGPEETAVWLQPDRRVPLDATIRGWAAAAVAGRTTPLGQARAIYDYVVDNLRYDKTGTGWGNGDIYWACDTKQGNCSDFHAVFIGYARAVGIPARFEIGLPLPPGRASGEISGYHCWAEFNLPGEGWIPVDASEANQHPRLRDYFFGAHDENRVLFTVGRDLMLPGMRDAPLNFFIAPYAEVDGKAFPGVTGRFFYQEIGPSVSQDRPGGGRRSGGGG